MDGKGGTHKKGEKRAECKRELTDKGQSHPPPPPPPPPPAPAAAPAPPNPVTAPNTTVAAPGSPCAPPPQDNLSEMLAQLDATDQGAITSHVQQLLSRKRSNSSLTSPVPPSSGNGKEGKEVPPEKRSRYAGLNMRLPVGRLPDKFPAKARPGSRTPLREVPPTPAAVPPPPSATASLSRTGKGKGNSNSQAHLPARSPPMMVMPPPVPPSPAPTAHASSPVCDGATPKHPSPAKPADVIGGLAASLGVSISTLVHNPHWLNMLKQFDEIEETQRDSPGASSNQAPLRSSPLGPPSSEQASSPARRPSETSAPAPPTPAENERREQPANFRW